ncbi:CD276 antigen-like [Coregonus clupeaformis]|uniref:CD276 antigen-like n=1 Tax=Coregonus clupeaformis TaxID=59861 RepID=UPI001E1C2A88|nr:CD276 antigen-like [Coregonus clupeaformis]
MLYHCWLSTVTSVMSWKSWVAQRCFVSLLIIKASYSVEFEISVPSEPQLAIVGQHAVLDCSFPVGKAWDLDNSVITWQRGLEVIHSFYHGQDKLDRQSSHYANRTSLYHSELERGNASLRLERTNLGDKGDYTCSVSTLLGSETKTFALKLAAYYPEPHLTFTASPRDVELLLTSQGGYPRPSVHWLDDSGDDVTNNTVTNISEDTQGLYTVFSTLNLQGQVNETITFVLKNKDLGQEIRREITLYSANERSSVEKGKISGDNRKTWIIIVPIVTFVLLLFVLLMSALRKTCYGPSQKPSPVYQTPSGSSESSQI